MSSRPRYPRTSSIRRECLALARDRCDAHPISGFTAGVEAIFEATVAAADGLADVLCGLQMQDEEEPGLGPQQLAGVRVAQLHVLSASAALDRLVGALRDR